MGNGVGVESSFSSGKRSTISFDQLEKLCRSGHFHQEHQQYLQALREAMLRDSLDYLEVLLIAGDTKKAQPLHLACSLGKLEAVELLLSAGYSGDLANNEGRTPLHMCCVVANAESGLCASLLCMQFPKSMKRLDYMGLNPLHFAAVQDNSFVLKAMVQHKADLKSTSKTGKTAMDLAKEHRCNVALNYLQSLCGGQVPQTVANTADVSQDRIMEIWEKFFENAFKKAGVDMEYEEDFDPIASFDGKHKKSKASSRDSYKAEWDDVYGTSSSPSKSKKAKTSSTKYDSSNDYKYQDDYWMQSDSKNSSSKNEKSKKAQSKAVEYYEPDDYLQWVLFYNDSISHHDDVDQQYFLMNKWSKESRWLNEHMNAMYASGYHFRFLYESYEDVEAMPYPTCLDEVKNYGWITFYSSADNYCMWMNMITGAAEYFLPLGMYEDPETLQQWGYVPCEHDASWYEADQSCAHAWIMVLTNEIDENNQFVYYFYNQFTSATSWEEPAGWNELVGTWGNWMLCCTEDHMDQQFWCNQTTGETAWVES